MENLPIEAWYMPIRYQDIVKVILIELSRKQKNPSCFLCQKSFKNEIIKTFHLNHFHYIHMNYHCEICQKRYSPNNRISDEPVGFLNVYELYIHGFECHDLNLPDIDTYI